MALLRELLANAGKADESIAEPAERAVAKLIALVADADPGLGGLLAREIDAARISGRTANAGDHHRLHDLIDLCIKQLAGSHQPADQRTAVSEPAQQICSRLASEQLALGRFGWRRHYAIDVFVASGAKDAGIRRST